MEAQATLAVHDRPRQELYEETLGFQKELLGAKIEDSGLPDQLVLVEHQPVYTVGRGEPFQAAVNDVPWVEVSRGGQATYHGPGQLVAYPIFDLRNHGKDVHVYLRKLEGAIIICLREFGIEGFRREGLTGVWVEDGGPKKIASIGVGVKKWVTYHGLSLNVEPDLSYFHAISPCGQEGKDVTSLKQLLGESSPSFDDVGDCLVKSVASVFNLDVQGEPLKRQPRPSWLRVKAPVKSNFDSTKKLVKDLRLVTVCEEARCPNQSECWSHDTATFMIMGEFCTRRCGFCSVQDGFKNSNLQELDALEPYRVAQAVNKLGLKHVVITSVNRDDLPDMGASHFHAVVTMIKRQNPECEIELLIPDMRGNKELLGTILQSGSVKVLNHNTETIPRLYKTVRPGSSFERSMAILRWSKELAPEVKTKSGLMVGLGESKEEVLEVMDELRKIDCDILTIGQYLQPTEKQLPIQRYVTPQEFEEFREEGIKRGFRFVESGPLVRSSYHAWKHAAGAEKNVAAA